MDGYVAYLGEVRRNHPITKKEEFMGYEFSIDNVVDGNDGEQYDTVVVGPRNAVSELVQKLRNGRRYELIGHLDFDFEKDLLEVLGERNSVILAHRGFN